MAVSNDTLRERIKKIAPELDTSEMDKKVLAATLERLTSSKGEKAVVLVADKVPKVKGPQFTVCSGCSVVAGAKGMMNEGAEIRPEWLAKGDHGIDALKILVEKKKVQVNWE